MKKNILFFAFILSFLLPFGAASQNAAKVANRQTAIRCLQLAKSYINQNIWDAVSSRIEMGLAYDDTISDLWYLKAVTKFHSGAPRSEILPLVEHSLNFGEWVDYNRDNARILYADLLCDTGLHEKALSVLDEEPFLFYADAEFIRVKCFYFQHTEEGLEKARNKVDSARRVYPADSRFARLFFRNEYSLMQENTSMTQEVRRIADAFISIIPKYSDSDSELELYAALFSEGENRERLLSAYNAKGLTHPLYASASLKANLMTQKEAVEYFVKWADVSVSFEYLKSFLALITEEDAKQFLNEYLTAYAGVITADTDGDLEPNLFVDYFRGRPKSMQWDKNNDGIYEWTAECDFGVPFSISVSKDNLLVDYGTYPYITKIQYKNKSERLVSVSLPDEQYAWTPFNIEIVPEFVQNPGCDFYFPVIKKSEPDTVGSVASAEKTGASAEGISGIDYNQIERKAIAYEIDSDEKPGAKISFSLLDGIPQSADYFCNGKRYAQSFFENGIPQFRAVDRNEDGIFETTETFAVDKDGIMNLTEEESKLLAKNVYGYERETGGLYVKMIQIDQNGDTKPDFTEEYSNDNGKITSWDSDNDGYWDTRYIRYPQKSGENLLEDSMFYLMPGKVLTTVSFVDKEPVKIISDKIEYSVIRGDTKDFYWVGKSGSIDDEKAVIKALAGISEQGICVLAVSGDVRLHAVKIAGKYYGKIILDEEIEETSRTENPLSDVANSPNSFKSAE